MTGSFGSVRVNERVHWVGAVDWNLRDFHGYSTSRGSTYNAYLILADKVTLIDTVKAPFFDEMMARIRSVIDPSEIDYVISNHTEMDHSGALPRTVAAVGPRKVFCSAMGAKGLPEHFDVGCELTPVRDGETLSLGDADVTFLETRMLHWPDSMFTYLNQDKLLFSSDAFGMHLASEERFDDELPAGVLKFEAAKYYANILLPYSALVTKLIGKVTELGLEFEMIAPDHGPIWRADPTHPVRWYARWAEQKPTRKALVVCDTMWHSTERMGRMIVEGLVAGGARATFMSLHGGANNRSDVVTGLLGAGALIVGSPTLNNGILPSVADVMTYLKGLKPRNLIGAAFGSYGWSGESVKQLNAMLEGMGVELVGEGVRSLHVPDEEALSACHVLGTRVAEALAQRCATE